MWDSAAIAIAAIVVTANLALFNKLIQIEKRLTRLETLLTNCILNRGDLNAEKKKA